MRLKKSISDWYVCSPKADPNWIIGWWIKTRNDQQHIQWKWVIDDNGDEDDNDDNAFWNVDVAEFNGSCPFFLLELFLNIETQIQCTANTLWLPRWFALCAPVHYWRTEIHKENATTTGHKSESHQIQIVRIPFDDPYRCAVCRLCVLCCEGPQIIVSKLSLLKWHRTILDIQLR